MAWGAIGRSLVAPFWARLVETLARRQLEIGFGVFLLVASDPHPPPDCVTIELRASAELRPLYRRGGDCAIARPRSASWRDAARPVDVGLAA
jgi:hypothetical protein